MRIVAAERLLWPVAPSWPPTAPPADSSATTEVRDEIPSCAPSWTASRRPATAPPPTIRPCTANRRRPCRRPHRTARHRRLFQNQSCKLEFNFRTKRQSVEHQNICHPCKFQDYPTSRLASGIFNFQPDSGCKLGLNRESWQPGEDSAATLPRKQESNFLSHLQSCNVTCHEIMFRLYAQKNIFIPTLSWQVLLILIIYIKFIHSFV